MQVSKIDTSSFLLQRMLHPFTSVPTSHRLVRLPVHQGRVQKAKESCPDRRVRGHRRRAGLGVPLTG